MKTSLHSASFIVNPASKDLSNYTSYCEMLILHIISKSTTAKKKENAKVVKL